MESFASLIYLAAAVLFILALRGLSHPETAQKGLNYGITGMALAVFTTLLLPDVGSYFLILMGIAIGGGIGASIANKIEIAIG